MEISVHDVYRQAVNDYVICNFYQYAAQRSRFHPNVLSVPIGGSWDDDDGDEHALVSNWGIMASSICNPRLDGSGESFPDSYDSSGNMYGVDPGVTPTN